MSVEIGMTVKDNDPRSPGRVMVVALFEMLPGGVNKAVLRHPDPRMKMHDTRVSVGRIFTDGKPRRSGWSVVA